MASSQKITANRINAARSTGPQSEPGKAASRTNALRHGALATVVTIDAEERAVFEDLVTALDADLRPVGPLEAALVEKIALALWRNRRLARAERGSLALQLRPSRIVRSASQEAFGGYGSTLAEDDLEPIDPETIAWNRAVLEELSAAMTASLYQLPEVAPNIYGQLVQDAGTEVPEGIRAHLAEEYENGLSEYIMVLMKWSRRQIDLAERRPQLLAITETMRDRAQLLPMPSQQLIARYQTTLDGQLYRAMRELRARQEARLEALEAEVVDDAETRKGKLTAA